MVFEVLVVRVNLLVGCLGQLAVIQVEHIRRYFRHHVLHHLQGVAGVAWKDFGVQQVKCGDLRLEAIFFQENMLV